MKNKKQKNNIKSSCYLYSFWISLVLLLGIFIGVFNKKLIRFGPPLIGEKELIFFGYSIDSWAKVSFIMAYIFINQVVKTYHNNLFEPWATNFIFNDSVRNINMSKNDALLCLNLDNIFGWISYFIDLNILLTMEFQFILCRLIASVITKNYLLFTKHFNEKKFKQF